MSEEVLSSHEYEKVAPALTVSDGVSVLTVRESSVLLNRERLSLSGALVEAILRRLSMEWRFSSMGSLKDWVGLTALPEASKLTSLTDVTISPR